MNTHLAARHAALRPVLLATVLLAAVLITVAVPARAGLNEWTTSGPFGGHVEALAIDPQDPDVLYAATLGGRVFKSIDAGGEWQEIGPLGAAPRALTIDPADSATLYAATQGGVFKSTDAGLSWQLQSTGLLELDTRAVAVDPANANTLYAATLGGVFKSTNAAFSWSMASTGLTDLDATALALDPTNPNVVYAGTQGGAFKSTNAAFSWTAVEGGLPAAAVRDLLFDPKNPNTVYAATGDAVFKSTDAGLSWSDASSGLASPAIVDLAVDPDNPNVLYAAGDGVWKSVDAAFTWNAAADGLAGRGVNALAVDPETPATVYAGAAGGGVFKSTDAALTWNATAGGLGATVVEALVAVPGRAVYAATLGDGLFFSNDAAVTWTAVGDGLGPDVTALAVDPKNLNTLYAGTPAAGVLKSTDAGLTWSGPTGGLPSLDVRALAVDPDNPNVVYAGTAAGVARTNDAAATWNDASAGLVSPDVRTLAIDPEDPDVLYAGSGDGRVFKTVDGALTWNDASTGLAAGRVFVLAVHPLNPDIVHAGTDAGLFTSIDGGLTWNPGNPVLAGLAVVDLFIDPPLGLYAGVADEPGGGFFRSTDGGSSLTRLENGLGVPQVTAVALDPTLFVVDPAPPNPLYAGTLGGGVYVRENVFLGLGDLVWFDADGDGIQDEGESGIPSVEVRLLDAADQVLETVFTDLDGFFVFFDLPPGDYRLEVPLPGGFIFSPPDRGGDDERDSDVDPATGRTPLVNLPEPGIDASFDAGLTFANAAVGDLVWHDLDADGVQDPDEPGFPGVTVRLLDGDGAELAMTTSNAQGFYLFSGLLPGAYAVEVVPPPEVRLSLPRAGDDPTLDSDVDLESGRSGVLNLMADERNTTVDAGLFRRGTITGIVWADDGDGVREEGEEGIVGATVRILLPRGTQRWFTLTEEGGRYSLDGLLRPGEYRLEVRLPPGYTDFSPVDRGGDDTVDSDIDPATGNTGLFTVRSGDPPLVFDAGLLAAAANPRVLELRDGRFTVELDWTDFRGGQGPGVVAQVPGSVGSPVILRSVDSTVLEFFSRGNWELLLKVLDGTSLNGHFWVFFAAATNVEFTVMVTDTRCGTTRTYTNPLGTAAPAVTDSQALVPCADPGPPSCIADTNTICLGEDERFAVDVDWRDFAGRTGFGRRTTLPRPGAAQSDDSGLLYFFSPDNWELLVKVLDGCDLNGHFWVFGAATTNVGYTLTVTDRVSGEVRTYTNPLGNSADALNDTRAFATCGMN